MRELMQSMQRAVSAPTRNPRLAVVIGRLLAAAFLICFVTGLYSHFLQEPLPWMRFPTQPSQLYQVTQGLHITAGIACFPLILGKLYTVFPRLFEWPPITGIASALERASIALFVGASLVEITIGLLNTFQFYPWPFGFREVHFALSFVIIGSLAIHIGVKLPIIARYWRRSAGYAPDEVPDAEPEEVLDAAADARTPVARSRAAVGGLTGRAFKWIDGTPKPPAGTSRRAFLATVTASVGAIVVLTAGQSFAWLSPFNAFAPRAKGVGPQSVPVNRTAAAAEITPADVGDSWALSVTVAGVTQSFSREQLLAMPLTTVDLPISCVEGWSQMATWTGVPVGDLVRNARAAASVPGSGAASTSPMTSTLTIASDQLPAIRITSLEKQGGYRVTQMGAEYVNDQTTLVALMLGGEPLDLDHGYPARMIAPGRPGVLQTKWLSSLEVLS